MQFLINAVIGYSPTPQKLMDQALHCIYTYLPVEITVMKNDRNYRVFTE